MTQHAPNTPLDEARVLLGELLHADDDVRVSALDALEAIYETMPVDGARILRDRMADAADRDMPARFWFFAARVFLRARAFDEARSAIASGMSGDDASLDLLSEGCRL